MNAPPTRFAIRPLAAEYAHELRTTRCDVFGQPIDERRDEAPHQCRVCLRLTAPGEAYLLLSHRAHWDDTLFAETGPVYIHARHCEPYADVERWPAEFPRAEVVLRAYDANHEIAAAELVGGRATEDVIGELFAMPRVAYLHARNSTYGCYMFRIDRA
jgi:hypothetical protein